MDTSTGQFMFEAKKKNSQVKHCTFTACFFSGSTNRQKFGGVGGVYPRKNFLNGFARTGKTAQNENGAPLAAPLPSTHLTYGMLFVRLLYRI